MENKGLTATFVFQASSLNYGEGIGNQAVLKKVTMADGKTYARVSRQALLYNVREQLPSGYLATLDQDASDKSVVQYSPSATVKDYPEIDLFGYMKTTKGSGGVKRSAVARLSDGIALTPFSNDEDFLTNMGLAKRLAKQIGSEVKNSIASSEISNDYYRYTLCVDLDNIGIDDNDGIEIANGEKAKRVNSLLDTINNLYRDIRGRREDLHPIFAIGGIYDVKRPFFENAIKVHDNNLEVNATAPEGTSVGIDEGYFDNEEQYFSCDNTDVDDWFSRIENDVSDYYAE